MGCSNIHSIPHAGLLQSMCTKVTCRDLLHKFKPAAQYIVMQGDYVNYVCNLTDLFLKDIAKICWRTFYLKVCVDYQLASYMYM